jgi:hypothetical protein
MGLSHQILHFMKCEFWGASYTPRHFWLLFPSMETQLQTRLWITSAVTVLLQRMSVSMAALGRLFADSSSHRGLFTK